MELFEVAKKAANAAASNGVSSNGPKVDALKQLKSFSITYDILVHSGWETTLTSYKASYGENPNYGL